MNTEKTREAIRYAIEVLNILWVSHHANRGDAAIEGLEELQATLSQSEPAHASKEQCNTCGGSVSIHSPDGEYRGECAHEIHRLQSRIEQLERELADGKLSRLDSECLRIGQQIHRAAGNLPEMFNIVIDIENGYGGVKLFNNAGDELDFETDSDGLSYSIEKAINAAIKEGKA